MAALKAGMLRNLNFQDPIKSSSKFLELSFSEGGGRTLHEGDPYSSHF